MTDMIPIGKAPSGTAPFYTDERGVGFDSQDGRTIDYGHCFDPERGYRIFYKFRDSEFANSWSAESLLRLCEFEPENEDQELLLKTARTLANQVIKLNEAWERLGKPKGGLPTEPQGHA